MKFKQLKLYTNTLEEEKIFYSEVLGFKLIEENSIMFSVKVGWSELVFEKSEKEYNYHYCFLIPKNKLVEALRWMEKRVPIITLDNGEKIQNFETWNADSFYFYDASGNLAEFIVRHDLKNNEEASFNSSKVLGVNEIGLPTNTIDTINSQLKKELGTTFWKGDLKRFGTHGTQEGIFLLPNYEEKTTWFPTPLKISPEPFEAIVENSEKHYRVTYVNKAVKINYLH